MKFKYYNIVLILKKAKHLHKIQNHSFQILSSKFYFPGIHIHHKVVRQFQNCFRKWSVSSNFILIVWIILNSSKHCGRLWLIRTTFPSSVSESNRQQVSFQLVLTGSSWHGWDTVQFSLKLWTELRVCPAMIAWLFCGSLRPKQIQGGNCQSSIYLVANL